MDAKGGMPRNHGPRPGLPALLVATRPRQWVKNLLVFAAPGAAGVVFHPGPFLRCLATFGIFVAASASTYLVNDVVDRQADRLHPKKQHRPIASGALSPASALTFSAVLMVAAVSASWLLSTALVAIVAAYIVITLAYTFALKQVPVIELACVAAGFILRAVAGGAAVHVPVSPWFVLVTSFGALFIVAGKRSAELEIMGEDGAEHRATLGRYPANYLRMVRTLAATVTVAAYCLWAFDRGTATGVTSHLRVHDLIWFELSIIPFVLAMLSVEFAIEHGDGGEPEELALRDRKLQALGLVWVLLLMVGIYS